MNTDLVNDQTPTAQHRCESVAELASRKHPTPLNRFNTFIACKPKEPNHHRAKRLHASNGTPMATDQWQPRTSVNTNSLTRTANAFYDAP
ncbi:hypothetical protein CEE69_17005 [Rhodopirellula bahusiensis]|uniref:Uncharacterized protein n=1 Tax=Rhodopirellula bahusiensis TaxID=2014065 RepID=A0A2G1W4P9_9BACT|nr:hypothetical protein CEE69_17005 [Rhodopirellula bahusiensis]